MSGSFFDSRWVDVPAGVTQVSGFAGGFSGAGVASGVKPSGRSDVAVIYSDRAVVSAARFTRSGVLAPPVLLCQREVDLAAVRAIVANSGNANAAIGSGEDGLDEARRMQRTTATRLGLEPEHVAVASTGVIGVPLPIERVEEGIGQACGQLAREGDADVAAAIMTTDAFEKRATLKLELPAGHVQISAQAKGAGMISPSFATMFCFVQTDALLEAQQCDQLLGVITGRSFDRITVDGQLSTNDSVILQANGDSGVVVTPESADEQVFGQALDALLRQLAILIVRDGEGAQRIGRVRVSGATNDEVERVARAVGNSPLVKTALGGGDPNWGRIAQAIGAAMPGVAPLPFDIEIEGTTVCSAGMAVTYDEQALAEAVSGSEVEYKVRLPGSGAECELFFSDLSHDYVTINSEYTT